MQSPPARGFTRAFLALALGLLAAPGAAQEPARPPLERIPLEVIFGPPGRTRVQLSPDGTRLGYLAPADGDVALRVRSLATGEESVAANEVRDFLWAEDDRHLLFLRGGHLHAHDPATGATRDLTPFDGVFAHGPVVSRRRPNEVLVQLNRRNPATFDVHRIDLPSAKGQLDTANPGDVVGWLADLDLRVRGAIAADPRDGSKHLRTRADADSAWSEIAVWPFEEEGGVVGFHADGSGLVVETSVGANTTRLFSIEAATGKERGLVAHDPRADVGRVLMDASSGAVQAVSFETLAPEWQVLDPAVAPDLEALTGLSRGVAWVASRDRADALWVVAFQPDDGPASYSLWRRAEKKLTELFSRRPALASQRLARRQGRVLHARDGTTLRAYLTLPANAAPQKLPLVIAVHGGPWARDRSGFDPVSQWLANRGYAVLQVNFRGSAGFGKAFLEAGFGQWGRGTMQTDLEDALGWAVREGIADPARVCVYGASYGGYAVLAGLAFTPDLFACGVALAAPANLGTLVESVPRDFAPLRARLLRRIGDVAGDVALNRRLSPVFHADAIRAPLLLAQGRDDPRARLADGEHIARSLRGRDVPVEHIVYDDEGATLEDPANRLDFFRRSETFLATHLP